MVLEFLREQGFCPDVDPDKGNIFFKYQIINACYLRHNRK